MKCWTIIFLLLSTHSFSQYVGKESAKHFAGFGFGSSQSWWLSRAENYTLYDHKGNLILEGNGHMRSQTYANSINLEVLAPLGNFRAGMGITFEEHQLYVMKVQGSLMQTRTAFTEVFRFNKTFFQLEIPLKENLENWDFAFNNRFGFYSFTDVNNLTLFGLKRMGRTFFGSCGFYILHKIGQLTYLYATPRLEYKYFRNTEEESPGFIYHNLISGGLMLGLRFHLL